MLGNNCSCFLGRITGFPARARTMPESVSTELGPFQLETTDSKILVCSCAFFIFFYKACVVVIEVNVSSIQL